MWNSANGWKNLDRRPWPETRIFIEMDSACKNQQVIEMRSKIVPGHFCYFFSIMVEFVQ